MIDPFHNNDKDRQPKPKPNGEHDDKPIVTKEGKVSRRV
jgi:hypothetical protein